MTGPEHRDQPPRHARVGSWWSTSAIAVIVAVLAASTATPLGVTATVFLLTVAVLAAIEARHRGRARNPAVVPVVGLLVVAAAVLSLAAALHSYLR